MAYDPFFGSSNGVLPPRRIAAQAGEPRVAPPAQRMLPPVPGGITMPRDVNPVLITRGMMEAQAAGADPVAQARAALAINSVDIRNITYAKPPPYTVGARQPFPAGPVPPVVAQSTRLGAYNPLAPFPKPTACEAHSDCAPMGLCMEGLCIPKAEYRSGTRACLESDTSKCYSDEVCAGGLCTPKPKQPSISPVARGRSSSVTSMSVAEAVDAQRKLDAKKPPMAPVNAKEPYAPSPRVAPSPAATASTALIPTASPTVAAAAAAAMQAEAKPKPSLMPAPSTPFKTLVPDSQTMPKPPPEPVRPATVFPDDRRQPTITPPSEGNGRGGANSISPPRTPNGESAKRPEPVIPPPESAPEAPMPPVRPTATTPKGRGNGRPTLRVVSPIPVEVPVEAPPPPTAPSIVITPPSAPSARPMAPYIPPQAAVVPPDYGSAGGGGGGGGGAEREPEKRKLKVIKQEQGVPWWMWALIVAGTVGVGYYVKMKAATGAIAGLDGEKPVRIKLSNPEEV